MSESPAQSTRATLHAIRAQLAAAGIESAATEAELILSHVLSESRGRLRVLEALDAPISAADQERAFSISDERAQRIPLQHLTGRAPFRSIELSVGPGVFVPRPETEITVEYAIEALRAEALRSETLEGETCEPIVVDLCTGSGAIALAIADEVREARIWAIEKSEDAHAWAKRNVAQLGNGHVRLLHGDVVDAATLLPPEVMGSARVVVSNPPYVPSAMVPREPEVRDHDPDLALYSGSDGLELIRAISKIARSIAAPGGLLVLEHGEEQGDAIRTLLTADGWHSATTYPDLTGRDRVTTAVLPPPQQAGVK